jgi:hypothetical protein
MRIEDAFVVDGVGIIVTGQPEDARIQVGTLLWLNPNGISYELVVHDVRQSFCVRGGDPKVAEVGLNTSLVLDGAPSGLPLRGL